MGLFGGHVPALYEEGEKVFSRLQHEIIKQSDDESIVRGHGTKIWVEAFWLTLQWHSEAAEMSKRKSMWTILPTQ